MEASTATITPKATRPKATPRFRVFQATEQGTWENLTEDAAVEAASKKEAIRSLAEDGEGRFLVIRETEYNPLTRRVAEVEIVKKAKETWA